MHIYLPNGDPLYEVPYADPKKGMRKATLRDARKVGGVPSVTEVLNILDKSGLNRWKETQILNSALTLPRGKNDTDDVYMAKIRQDAKELSTLARDEGTRIHDALESAFKDRVIDRRYHRIAHKVKDAVNEYFDVSGGWTAEETFAHPAGYGGKSDLIHRRIVVVADFKTKEEFKTDTNGKITKMAYDEHCMQLIAYAKGFSMVDARLVNIFVDYNGETVFHEWKSKDIERAYHMFMACLKLWKLQKRYDPTAKMVAA